MKKLDIKLERFGKDGWFFLTCRNNPGLCLFGPTPESLKAQLAEAGKLLFDAQVSLAFSHPPAQRENEWIPVEHQKLMAAA